MTTDQATPTIDPAVAAEALAGPWQAVLLNGYGFTVTLDEAIADADEDGRIEVGLAIVRSTAIPESDGEAIPDGHNPPDAIYLSVTGDDRQDDAAWLRGTWVQAQAMVAGLNTAAEATR